MGRATASPGAGPERPEVDDDADDGVVIDLRSQPGAPAGTGVDLWSAELRTPECLASAIDELRHEYGDPDTEYGVYFLDGLDPRSSLGRAVELERFTESFDNDAEYLRRLYGDFEQIGATELICVVDHVQKRPAGVIRTVRNTASHGCRILNDLQHHGENGWGLTWDEILERSDFAARRPEDIIDIPTIAVGKNYQGAKQAGGVSKALMAAVMRRALQSDANTWVCSLDRIPYILIQAATQNVMHEFEGVPGQPYYGAPDTVPLWSNFREYEAYLRRDHPGTRAWVIDGVGLERYFFAYPEGEFTFEPLPVETVDLRRYEPVDSR